MVKLAVHRQAGSIRIRKRIQNILYIYFEDKETYWLWCNDVADAYKEWIEDGGDNEEERYHREQNKEAENLKPSDVEGDDEFATPF